MASFLLGNPIPLPPLIIRNPDTGVLEDLDATPDAADVTVWVDNVLNDPDTVTITKLGTGHYVMNVIPSGVVAGSRCVVAVDVTYDDLTTDRLFSETYIAEASPTLEWHPKLVVR